MEDGKRKWIESFLTGKYTGSSKTLVGEDLFLPFTFVEVVDDWCITWSTWLRYQQR